MHPDATANHATAESRVRHLHTAPCTQASAAGTMQPSIEAILADPRSVRPVYQPIVDLSDGDVVGYEALARWPQHPTVDPAEVFEVAAAKGVVVEFDWACRSAALDGALQANLTDRRSLFLNVEPTAAGMLPDRRYTRIRDAIGRLDIVLELTERSLLSDPASVLRLVDRARRNGCRIALDDIGSHPDSLALLEFIAPDIIKLDHVLVQDDPTPKLARIIAAVTAHAASTGALILAEGIETDDNLERARAYGAVLGQGWMFGRPGPLPYSSITTEATAEPRPLRNHSIPLVTDRVPAVPSELLDAALPAIGRKPLVAALTRQIEQYAEQTHEPLMILSTFQSAQFFDSTVARRYADLAAANTFVAALGVGMAPEPAPGVHGTDLHPGEPLTRQWTIVVVGQHYFAAVIARDLGDIGAEDTRRFEFLHTHDRRIVVAAARSLMCRVIPPFPPHVTL